MSSSLDPFIVEFVQREVGAVLASLDCASDFDPREVENEVFLRLLRQRKSGEFGRASGKGRYFGWVIRNMVLEYVRE